MENNGTNIAGVSSQRSN